MDGNKDHQSISGRQNMQEVFDKRGVRWTSKNAV